MRSEIFGEIMKARRFRLAWTPYRKFHDLDERMGAMICGSLTCRNASEYVSYGTGFVGRTVLCGECLAKREKRGMT
jgi:hypothetical protein